MAKFNPSKASVAREKGSSRPERAVPFIRKKDLQSSRQKGEGQKNAFRILPITDQIAFPSSSYMVEMAVNGKNTFRSFRSASSAGIYEYFAENEPALIEQGHVPQTIADYVIDLMTRKASKDKRLAELVKEVQTLTSVLIPVVATLGSDEMTWPAQYQQGMIKFLDLNGAIADKFWVFATDEKPKTMPFTWGVGRAFTIGKELTGSGKNDVAYHFSGVYDVEAIPAYLTDPSLPIYQAIGDCLYEGEASVDDQFKLLCDYFGIPVAEQAAILDGFNQLPLAVTKYDDATSTMDYVKNYLNESCKAFIEDSIAEDTAGKAVAASVKSAPARVAPSAKAAPVAKPEPAYAADELDEQGGEEDAAEDDVPYSNPAPQQAPAAAVKPRTGFGRPRVADPTVD